MNRAIILKWTPRILLILFALFISMFALDAFEEGFTFMTLMGFFMHMIPTLAIVALLIFAWYHPKWGGYFLVGLAAVFTIFFDLYKEIIGFLLIGLPPLFAGILFILSAKHHKKTKHKKKN